MPSFQGPFWADFTTNIAESSSRYTQPAVKRQILRSSRLIFSASNSLEPLDLVITPSTHCVPKPCVCPAPTIVRYFGHTIVRTASATGRPCVQQDVNASRSREMNVAFTIFCGSAPMPLRRRFFTRRVRLIQLATLHKVPATYVGGASICRSPRAHQWTTGDRCRRPRSIY